MARVFAQKATPANLTGLDSIPSSSLLIRNCWAQMAVVKLAMAFLLVFDPAHTLMAHSASGATLVIHSAYVDIYFSPRGGAEAAIIRTIGEATDDVSVLAYSFTSDPISAALIAAHRKGVQVRVVLDKSQCTARGSKLQRLKDAKIPVYIDYTHAISHNKVMIIDRQIVITGSFNFTKSAEDRNAENLLIIHSHPLSEKYLQDFERHMGHARAE